MTIERMRAPLSATRLTITPVDDAVKPEKLVKTTQLDPISETKRVSEVERIFNTI